MSPEQTAAVSEGMRASWADPEKRAARIEAMKARWRDPVFRAACLEARRGARPAQSAAQTEAWTTPEKRARIIAGINAAWANPKGARKASRDWQDAILADYQAGLPVAVIADKHGCTPSFPAVLAKRRGVARRPIGHPEGA